MTTKTTQTTDTKDSQVHLSFMQYSKVEAFINHSILRTATKLALAREKDYIEASWIRQQYNSAVSLTKSQVSWEGWNYGKQAMDHMRDSYLWVYWQSLIHYSSGLFCGEVYMPRAACRHQCLLNHARRYWISTKSLVKKRTSMCDLE